MHRISIVLLGVLFPLVPGTNAFFTAFICKTQIKVRRWVHLRYSNYFFVNPLLKRLHSSFGCYFDVKTMQPYAKRTKSVLLKRKDTPRSHSPTERSPRTLM